MSNSTITDDVIFRVAHLARIDVSPQDAKVYAKQLESILEHFDSLNRIDATGVEPTYQVTGLKNITRPDVIDHDRMFTQKQALSNAKKTKNGYFVTNSISKK